MTASLFSNVQIADIIHRGDTMEVYRATRLIDQSPVIVSTCVEQPASATTISRLRFTAELLPTFDHPNIAKLKDWVSDVIRPYLVLEDIRGITLDQYLNRFDQKRLSVAQFLAIAIQLATALKQIHAAEITHKHFHSDSLLINPDTGQIQVIDFGHASLLTQEQPSVIAPESLDGNLAFYSPEQTGRMNRALDYRTDFYTLGIVFYQCLVGELPFAGDDNLSTLYEQLSSFATPVNEVCIDIPEPLSQIVEKLLQKNAEERYQSASGLLHDLQQCLKQWQEFEYIAPFPLAKNDETNRFQIPQKLYGRSKEVNLLMACFHQAVKGDAQCIAIAGSSGIGKSALVHEMHKPIAAQNGLFMSGKFDQFQQNVPYSSLKIALRQGLNQLLSSAALPIADLRQALLQKLDVNATVLTDFMEEFIPLLGQLEPAPKLGAQETQARFHIVMQGLIKTLSIYHPLVIFIDDLQWADQGTLKLLPELLSEPGARVLVIVAYRDNEVDEHHPVYTTLQQINRKGEEKNQRASIDLCPLPIQELKTLLQDTLHQDRQTVAPLARLVNNKTRGNPFFVQMFLKMLYEKGRFKFNNENHYWQWNLSEIEKESMTDNVVALMAQKMAALPSDTQALMRIAACIGTRFDLQTLALVAEQSITDCAHNLWPALKAHLLIQEGGDWLVGMSATSAFVTTKEKQEENQPLHWIPRCKFIHDRMLQAASESIPIEESRTTHLCIGRVLQLHTSEQEREARVFEFVEHLNQGASLITKETERQSLAKLNLLAADKAKQASVWSAAVNYATIASQLNSLSEQQSEQQDKAFSIRLLEILAECEYLCGQIELAEKHYETLLEQVDDHVKKAKIYTQRLIQHIGRGQFQPATAMGKLGLSLLDIELPDDETALEALVHNQASQLEEQLKITPLNKIHQLPTIQNEYEETTLSLLLEMSICGMLTEQSALLEACTQKAMLQSLSRGKSPLLPRVLAQYALLLNGKREFDLAYSVGQQTLAVLDQTPNCPDIASVLNSIALACKFLKRPYSETVDIFTQGYELGLRNGELARAAISKANILGVKMVDGSSPESIISAAEKSLDFASQKHLQLPGALLFMQYGRSLKQNKNLLTSEFFSTQAYQMMTNSIFRGYLDVFSINIYFWSGISLVKGLTTYQQSLKNFSVIKNSICIPDYLCFVCLTILNAKRSNKFVQFEASEQNKWDLTFSDFIVRLQEFNHCYPQNHQQIGRAHV